MKKIPQRMCIGCGEMFDKRTLIRIVHDKENNIFIDLTGKANGRGAYVCRSEECLKKARKTKRLERAFKTAINIEIYGNLEKQMSENIINGVINGE